MKALVDDVRVETFTKDLMGIGGGVAHQMVTGREITMTIKLLSPTQEEMTALCHCLPGGQIIDFHFESPIAPPSAVPETARVSESNPAAGSW